MTITIHVNLKSGKITPLESAMLFIIHWGANDILRHQILILKSWRISMLAFSNYPSIFRISQKTFFNSFFYNRTPFFVLLWYEFIYCCTSKCEIVYKRKINFINLHHKMTKRECDYEKKECKNNYLSLRMNLRKHCALIWEVSWGRLMP